jgi:hypothetical protein
MLANPETFAEQKLENLRVLVVERKSVRSSLSEAAGCRPLRSPHTLQPPIAAAHYLPDSKPTWQSR